MSKIHQKNVKLDNKLKNNIEQYVNNKFNKATDIQKSEIVKILKKSDNKLLGFPFALKYYYSLRSREYEMFYMPKYQNVISLHKYKETFVLDEPVDYYKGRPVYAVVQGHPISLSMVISTLLKKNFKSIYLKGRSSSDLYAKLHSPYIQRFFALKGLTMIQWISIILSILLSITLTFMITYMFYTVK